MDAFLATHLQGVSRTYAILVPLLPDPLADAVGVAYLLMRIVDTLEDDPRLSTDERLRYFASLEAALGGSATAAAALAQPLGDTDDERALMRDAAQVLLRVQALEPEYYAAIVACAQAMTEGVRRLLARSAERGLAYPAVRGMAELREYCYYVAGVVGEMLCTMMAHFLRWPELRRRRDQAVELGIGLQLVNILKDAGKDSAQGRRYLPLAGGGADRKSVV
jgi:farnesyl-diphosphate farnesyltransferase